MISAPRSSWRAPARSAAPLGRSTSVTPRSSAASTRSKRTRESASSIAKPRATSSRLPDRTCSTRRARSKKSCSSPSTISSAGSLEEIVLGLERRVEGHDLRLSGPVRVTLPDPFVPLVLSLMREFRETHPDITVTLATEVGFANLAHRDADIAIRIADEPPPDLVGRKLASAAVAIYGSTSYLSGRRAKDLEALDWVGFEIDSSMAFERWVQRNIPNARLALRVSTAWGVRDAVDAGFGVGVFPCALGGMRPNWRRVQPIRDASAPLWILTHKDLRTTARVRVLRDFLAGAIVKRRGIVEGKGGSQ